MVRLDSTHFDFDRAQVLPAGRALLQTVVDAMIRDGSIRISVEGHTDRYGPASYNERLASSRVAAVTAMLRRLAGTANVADRIVTKGYGEQCLLVTAGDDEAEPPPARRPRVSAANRAAQAPNRRVEIWQLLPGETAAPGDCRAESQRSGRVPFSSMR
jgi:outer membrane protein OmpA-like peptidoglycan-associated protein